MNVVIDEDLPRSLGITLSALGFTVFDVRDYGLRGSSDEEVFRFAQRQKAILFTADLGFSNIFYFPPGEHHGICVLRFPENPDIELFTHIDGEEKSFKKVIRYLNSNLHLLFRREG